MCGRRGRTSSGTGVLRPGAGRAGGDRGRPMVLRGVSLLRRSCTPPSSTAAAAAVAPKGWGEGRGCVCARGRGARAAGGEMRARIRRAGAGMERGGGPPRSPQGPPPPRGGDAPPSRPTPPSPPPCRAERGGPRHPRRRPGPCRPCRRATAGALAEGGGGEGGDGGNGPGAAATIRWRRRHRRRQCSGQRASVALSLPPPPVPLGVLFGPVGGRGGLVLGGCVCFGASLAPKRRGGSSPPRVLRLRGVSRPLERARPLRCRSRLWNRNGSGVPGLLGIQVTCRRYGKCVRYRRTSGICKWG